MEQEKGLGRLKRWHLAILVLLTVLAIISVSYMWVTVSNRANAQAATLPPDSHQRQMTRLEHSKPYLQGIQGAINTYHLVYINLTDSEQYHLDSFPSEDECFDARESQEIKDFILDMFKDSDPRILCQSARHRFLRQ